MKTISIIGHVDSGKSTLFESLVGVKTDTFQDENNNTYHSMFYDFKQIVTLIDNPGH